MSFWDMFKNKVVENNPNLNTIYLEIEKKFSNKNHEDLAKLAALASMMARIANVDLNITEDETMAMVSSVEKWFQITAQESKTIVDIVVTHTKILSGMEDHLYARELNPILSKEEKLNFLCTLFSIAAADGEVSAIEENEVYMITKELRLERKEYVSAKMTVLKYLGALKN